MDMRPQQKTKIEEIDLSYIPSIIDPDDLYPNGKLLNDEMIAHLKQILTKKEVEEKEIVELLNELPINVLATEYKNTSENININLDNIRYSKKELGLPRGIIIQDGVLYAVYKELGRGGFGKVKLAQNLETGEWFALKVQREERAETIIKNREKNKKLNEKITGLKRESKEKNKDLAMLKKIEDELKKAENEFNEFNRHLYYIKKGKKAELKSEAMILKKLDMAQGVEILRKTKDDTIKHNVLMKYAPGMNISNFLDSRMQSENKLTSREWCDIIMMMLEAVKELHAKGILHRDIKPRNFIYDPINYKVKLIDMGLARESANLSYESDDQEGTSDYMAPEICFNEKNRYTYNEATEIYALGESITKILRMSDDYLDFDKPDATIFSDNGDVMSFIANNMQNHSPKNRPTLQSTIEFFQQIRNELTPIKHITLGIIDINEYAAAAGDERIKFIAALQNLDQVILISRKSDGMDQNGKYAYLPLINELENEAYQLIIRKTIFSVDEHLIAELPDYIAAKNPDRIHQFHYFGKTWANACKDTVIQPVSLEYARSREYRKEIRKHSSVVSEKDIVMTIDLIVKERTRLNQKYQSVLSDPQHKSLKIVIKRIKSLNVALFELEKFKENKQFTYEQLFNTLEQIKNDMTPTSFISKLLRLGSHSAKKIEKKSKHVRKSTKQFRL